MCQWANLAGTIVPVVDVGYSIPIVSVAAGQPIASTTYYFGADPISSIQTVYAMASVIVLRSGTIRAAFLKARITTPGTAELATHSLRINDATDVLVATGAYNSTVLDVSNLVLNQAVVAGDTVAFKLATPAWVTPPQSVRWEGYIVVI
jgi:hypothetical protein